MQADCKASRRRRRTRRRRPAPARRRSKQGPNPRLNAEHRFRSWSPSILVSVNPCIIIANWRRPAWTK
eukprot:3301121-Pyramimonas_sp.AAC.1